MKRRVFLQWSLLTAGSTLLKTVPVLASDRSENRSLRSLSHAELYKLFKDPPPVYRPFVRWWWNGDKVEKEELERELRLLKDAGIGGVEINPVKFPARTSDLNKPTIQWLSPDWIDLLQFTFKTAASLGLTCDLIVGSGWPFGAEYLEGEERSQVVATAAIELEGPLDFEVSLFDMYKEADPAITSPYMGRTMEMLSVKLVPASFKSMDDITDFSAQIPNQVIKGRIPEGKFMLYGLVRVHSFMEVINGAPGANGPILNHYNKAAVEKYLNRMSDAIRQQAGAVSEYVRSFFTDSMELEGANWCSDMAEEFRRRRGYDLMPYLPFIMGKTGAMGNTYVYDYGAEQGTGLKEIFQRVRYDFDVTKTELIKERFIDSFTAWCRQNNVLSRVQAYGRGYHPLEGSFDIDLPECETWIKYGLGTEMSETDYRIGRAYTMINKYVSSAAHLKGKRHISCEELTNTDMVFNDTLEILKVAGDQSTISGVTHPVFHGFNYSPPQAPFPGWIRYGTYFNERNTWWPYFRMFTNYKARISALLQHADMFADIAVLPPVADMWSLYGAQNEPFPSLIYPQYVTLIWESMHQNGNACDYVSEKVICDAEIKNGRLLYGNRSYHTLFLVQVERIEPATARKLADFVSAGGRIFCIETYPCKSPGLLNRGQHDQEVRHSVEQMKTCGDRFVLLKKPESNFCQWYRNLQKQYNIVPYISIDQPDPFVTQVRYQTVDAEIILVTNSSLHNSHPLNIRVCKEITSSRQAWIWDAESGERYRIECGTGPIALDLAPADARLLVFDKEKKGPAWKPAPTGSKDAVAVPGKWTVECRHINGSVITKEMNTLQDLKALPDLVHFAGTLIYRTQLNTGNAAALQYCNLGKVAGVSELLVNGKSAGTQWYGRRIYAINKLLQNGGNTIEVKVVTVMGNYLKTLKDNAIAQYWTNEKRKDQPLQSMGLIGPVTLY